MITDVLYLNSTWRFVFPTFDPADGMTPMDADSTPTVSVRKNGSSVGDSVTVTNIGTGLYALSYNPSGEVAGDQFDLVVSATVDSQQSNLTIKLTVPDLTGTTVGALSTDERDAIAAALLDLVDGIESGVTLREAQRAMAAILAGIVSGAGTGTEVFKGIGQASGGTTRATVTVDANGNRTAVSLP